PSEPWRRAKRRCGSGWRWPRQSGESWQTPGAFRYDEPVRTDTASRVPLSFQLPRFAMAKFAVILPAAGQSSRFRDKEKKPFALLDGRAVWLRCAELFVTRPDVCQTVLVVNPADMELFRRRFTANIAFMDIKIVDGGAERFESVANALAVIKPEADFVAVHDAVRPCLTEELINKVFAEAEKKSAALLAVPVGDTLKQVDDQRQITGTVDRKGLWQAQTPQVFK